VGALSRAQLRQPVGLTLSSWDWQLEFERGPAGALHARSVAGVGGVGGVAGAAGDAGAARGSGRLVRVLEAAEPALVLGSAQRLSDVDVVAARRAGVEVVRRRSGGGAVLVGPGQVLWIDLVIRAGDPLWDQDVSRASWWVGDAWAAAIDACSLGPCTVWKTAMKASRWSGQVCFAGIGPGEVLVGDQKVVGLSQRRTRQAALFQTAALLTWDPTSIVGLLDLDDDEAAEAVAGLSRAARALGADHASALLEGLRGALERHGPVVEAPA
jgi:lipoate---protein ligase